jgi:hypothetical protein
MFESKFKGLPPVIVNALHKQLERSINDLCNELKSENMAHLLHKCANIDAVFKFAQEMRNELGNNNTHE